VLKARLAIIAWLTLYLIKTNQKNKIITIFKNRGIFLKHAEYIASWKQDKDNQGFAKRVDQEMRDEIDSFLNSR